MYLKQLCALAGVAALAASATSAEAAVTFMGYETGLQADEVLITGFEGGPTLADVTFELPGFALTGNGQLTTGSLLGVNAAPAFSATTTDQTQYLSLNANQSATLTTPELSAIAFYVGSLDAYNSFTFTLANGTTEVVTGAMLATLPGMDANGSQTGFTTNGLLRFSFDSAITGVTMASSGYSFEISDIRGTAIVPEPASWALMILGFGGVGVLMRTQRTYKLALA